VTDEILAKSAYVSMLAEGEDPCGITLLAGKAVVASFVGTLLSTFMLGELLRQLHGASRLCLIDGSLRAAKVSAFSSKIAVDPIPFCNFSSQVLSLGSEKLTRSRLSRSASCNIFEVLQGMPLRRIGVFG
jgi:hypothetical protein